MTNSNERAVKVGDVVAWADVPDGGDLLEAQRELATAEDDEDRRVAQDAITHYTRKLETLTAPAERAPIAGGRCPRCGGPFYGTTHQRCEHL